MSRSFTWPGVTKDVAHCRSCKLCQRYNKPEPPKAPMICRKVVTEPFERACIDIVGPLPKARGGGYTHMLAYICVVTRWPEAIPLRSTQARPVAEALLDIFSRNGMPRVIISDQGVQLTGKVMQELVSMYGISKVECSPYRPQSNGIVERFHETLVPLFRSAVLRDLIGSGFYQWPCIP